MFMGSFYKSIGGNPESALSAETLLFPGLQCKGTGFF